MSGINWQLIVVVLALGAAAAHLAHRGIRVWRSGQKSRTGACGSCRSCSSESRSATANATGFVPLETLRFPDPKSHDAGTGSPTGGSFENPRR
ncbi:MAG TPA: hypothetical protein VGM05_26755 [Planctomycetaceae bacterium]|jgi:hypothetical protein